MDKKAREIIGLPVVTMNRGTKIYDVEDMILDPERGQVLVLIVQHSSLFHSARAIPFGRINTIGRDAVVVPDGRVVIDVKRDPVLRKLDNGQLVRGLRVLTDDGRKLGTVDDMLLDARTGQIRGYYVSLGRGLTVGQGLRWLPAEQVTSIGQRVMFVPASVADEFEQQLGGIAGALEGAGNKVRAAGAQLNSQLEQVGSQIKQSVPQRTNQLVVGKVAHNRVQDRDGNVIVEAGDTVTEEAVQKARDAERTPQLLLSVGAGPARQSATSLGEEINNSLSTIPGEARNLWAQITGNYNKVVDRTDDRLLQRRIKQALGRPVTRVILDNSDNIILNTGDIVTNRAIDMARSADVLDILVDSIYMERPKLELNDLKASRSGDGSLENREAGLSDSTPIGNSSQNATTNTPNSQPDAQDNSTVV